MTSLATLGHQHYMLEIHVAASETSIERLPLLEKTTKVLPSCLDCVCIFLAPKPLVKSIQAHGRMTTISDDHYICVQ